MIRFSIFSVLDHYEDGVCTLSTLYAQFLDLIVEAERLGFAAYWFSKPATSGPSIRSTIFPVKESRV